MFVEFAFLSKPGQADIQSDLFYDYRTNVEAYPKWQAWMPEKQRRLLVIWGKYDLSFAPSEPEAYRRDVPNAEVHVSRRRAFRARHGGRRDRRIGAKLRRRSAKYDCACSKLTVCRRKGARP